MTRTGETPFAMSLAVCSMDADTDTSRPGRSCTSTPGLADQKDTDRLMDMMTPATDSRQPRPSVCPICGLAADNGVVRHSELTATATYCDTAGHLWAVTWLEVA